MNQPPRAPLSLKHASNWIRTICLASLISSLPLQATVVVEGTFTDRPGANETVVFKYTASLASIVNSVGNLPGFTNTTPRSSQVSWKDPAGATLQGDARYSNPLYNNGDFKLDVSYSTAPNHPVSLIAATVHFTNGVADGATLGKGLSGNTSNTGNAAALKLSGIDQGRIATVGDPVQLATGAATMKRTLFKLSGARDWEFGLAYNSALAAAQDVGGPVGFGWCHPFEARVVVSGVNRVVQFNHTQACTFVPSSDDPAKFVSSDDGARHDILSALPGGGWELTRRDQSSRRFDADGVLVEDRDRHGHKLMLVYDGSGRVASITDPISGTRLAFTYIFGTPRIDTITDSTGARVVLTYDSERMLSKVVNQNGKKTTFAYDSNRALLTLTDDAGVVLVSNTYDADGHVVTQDDAVSDNELLRISYVEEGLPGCNLYAASDVAKIVPLPLPRVGTFSVDRFTRMDGKTIEYAYDATGRLQSATVEGRVTTIGYDDRGTPVSVTDADGQVTPVVPRIRVSTINRAGENIAFEFDSNYNLLAVTNPLGQTTRYTYDNENNLLSVTDALNRVTTFAYDGFGNVVKMIDPAGKETRHTYDSLNNLVATTDPAGGVTTLAYDQNNNLTSLTNPLGQRASWTYGPDALLVTAISPRGGTVRYERTAGRITRVTDATGVVNTFAYDGDGRLLNREDALGKRTTFTYDQLGNVVACANALNENTTYTYDHRNRLIGTTGPAGETTTRRFDGNGNLESVTNALGGTTTFMYDGEDRRVAVTDAMDHTTGFGYDRAGCLSSFMNAAGDVTHVTTNGENELSALIDAGGARLDVDYDARGWISRITDSLHRSTTYDRDELGRCVGIEDPLTRRTKVVRDAVGNVVQVTDPNGLICRQGMDENGDRNSYVDPQSNTTMLGSDAAGRPVSLTTPENRLIKASYDARGLLASVTEPSGRITSFTYDAAQRWSDRTDSLGTIQVERDGGGRVVALRENGKTLERSYDPVGRLKSCRDAEGNVIGYEYDECGKMTRLIYPDGRAVIYAYDAAGRLATVSDWNGRTTAFSYDVHGRIAEMARPNGTKQLRTYDDAGQLVRLRELAPDGTPSIYSGEFVYDAGGQLVQEQVVPDSDATTADCVQTFDRDNRLRTHNGAAVDFDADGNLLSVNSGSLPASFVYDARNRLTSAGGIGYEYDVAGRRTGITDAKGRTHFVLNPGEVLDQVLVRTAPDGTQTYYVYGLGILQEETGTSIRYYHCNRRGDTVALTDANGVVTDRMSYGPYGEMTSRTGSTDTPFLFNGRWGVQTDASGLTYHRSRYYHPGLRRFLNQDTVLGSVLIPATLNRFAYTRGNPIRFIDPTGYYDEDVHHDLTFNLAVRAGFSREEAERIAAADQGVDDNETTSPFASVEARRDFHFTTPERRERMLQSANDANDLALFGQYLHAEQDSYSHQHGQADRDGDPYGPRLGHLLSGHAPDRTSERPELALKMAERTYQQLRRFHDRTHASKSCDDWENMRPVIDEWVRVAR